MGYVEIGVCIASMIFYFNAGKFEARSGAADHSVLWAALSLLTSVPMMSLGWKLKLLAQAGLFIAIAVVRALRGHDE